MKKIRLIFASVLMFSLCTITLNEVNASTCDDVPGNPALNTGTCRTLDITVNGVRKKSLSCGDQIDQSPLDCIQPPQ
jgi:hypothetical protein